MTVMGDALMEGLSDAGSIPARSTKKAAFDKCQIAAFYLLCVFLHLYVLQPIYKFFGIL